MFNAIVGVIAMLEWRFKRLFCKAYLYPKIPANRYDDENGKISDAICGDGKDLGNLLIQESQRHL